jgi:hypothetical protein
METEQGPEPSLAPTGWLNLSTLFEYLILRVSCRDLRVFQGVRITGELYKRPSEEQDT